MMLGSRDLAISVARSDRGSASPTWGRSAHARLSQAFAGSRTPRRLDKVASAQRHRLTAATPAVVRAFEVASSPVQKRKLILDVDTGTDDAVAIMLAALHPALDLVA